MIRQFKKKATNQMLVNIDQFQGIFRVYKGIYYVTTTIINNNSYINIYIFIYNIIT